MAKLAFVSKDFTDDIKKQGSTDYIEIKSGSIKIEVLLDIPDAIFKDVKNDATFIQNAHDRIKKDKLFSTFIDRAAFHAMFYDTLCVRALVSGNESEIKNHQKRFMKAVEEEGKKLETGVKKALQAQWDHRQKVLQDRKSYKIKVMVNMAVGAVGVAGGIAGLATAATPAAPATLVPAIIGLVKAGSGLLNNLRKAYLKAEQMDKEIGRKLTLYKKFFEKHKDVAKVTELSGVVLSQWTGGFSDFGLPTLKQIGGDIGTLNGKIAGMEKDARVLSIKLNEALDKSADLDKAFDGMKNDFTKQLAVVAKLKNPNSKKVTSSIKDAMKTIEKTNQAADELHDSNAKLIEQVIAMNEDIAERRKNQETYKKMVDSFEKINNVSKWGTAGQVIGYMSDLAFAGAGGGSAGWATAEKQIATSLKMVQSVEKAAISELLKKV